MADTGAPDDGGLMLAETLVGLLDVRPGPDGRGTAITMAMSQD